jgi:hypothetical protein
MLRSVLLLPFLASVLAADSTTAADARVARTQAENQPRADRGDGTRWLHVNQGRVVQLSPDGHHETHQTHEKKPLEANLMNSLSPISDASVPEAPTPSAFRVFRVFRGQF